MLENECIRLEHGRTLSYAVYGSPMPRTTIMYMHGFPSSRFEGKLWHSACAKHHIRLIAPDRPGMGASAMQTNRSILDWPTDLLLLASHLKISQFYILAVSGGGPYALACTKQIPAERLLGVSIVSGLYPIKLGTAGMMIQTRVMLWAAPWIPGLASFLFDGIMGKAARNKDPQVFEHLMAQEMDSRHQGDREVIKEPQNWPVFVAMTREAFGQGSDGVGWEARLLGSEWGFDLSQLRVGEDSTPLTLWHGKDDIDCPATMAEKANELIPGSVLRLQDGEGHASFIFRYVDEILDNLVCVAEPEGYIQFTEMEEYVRVGLAG
jgi:pimeloyl-ACP methyl ester carboxylesterase